MIKKIDFLNFSCIYANFTNENEYKLTLTSNGKDNERFMVFQKEVGKGFVNLTKIKLAFFC